MHHIRNVLWLVVAAVLGGGLVGCGQTTVRLGWLGSNLPGRFSASYLTFTGAESRRVRADAGQTLILTYDIDVAKGTLTLQVEAPDSSVVWADSFPRGLRGSAELPLEQDGSYAIVVHGDNAGGSFLISWDLE
jgi:hypothetical protein